MDKDTELVLLRNLEQKVTAMFEFTEWDQDTDEEPAAAYRAALCALHLIELARAELGKGASHE